MWLRPPPEGKTDVLRVATVYFGLGDRLGLKWLRDSVEKLPVAGQWHAHARGSLRDELVLTTPQAGRAGFSRRFRARRTRSNVGQMRTL